MNGNIPAYKTWRDKGENIGVQCLKCTRIHWTFDTPPTDPVTKAPCNNCIDIKNGQYILKETALHAEEKKAYQEKLTSTQNPESIEPFTCKHEPSQ